MESKFQRWGLVLVVVAVVLYGGYRAYIAGGLEELMQGLRGGTPSPSASPTATAAPSKMPLRTGTPPPVTPQVTPTNAGAQVLFSINDRRAGSVVLESNAILTREAQEHAADMVRRGYFDHTDPDGVTFQQRMAASGYPATAIAENLGLTSGNDASVVVGLWMESQGHRENMLNPAYAGAGIGVARGMWQGQEVLFVVAIFGASR